jgi:molybdenum cofactor cytidylyltransferase
MISAVVLAAGLSSRMGALKQLLPYGDRSVIEQVVTTLQSCPVDEIIVVLGHRDGDIRAALAAYPVRIAFNARYREEMLTSIQSGWSQASPQTDAVMHVLGDQPHLQASVVRKLVAAFHDTGAGIYVPSYNHRRGHPILIPARYRTEIGALGPQATMRDFMRAHSAEIHHLTVDTDAILRDMDTPEEYEREIQLKRVA